MLKLPSIVLVVALLSVVDHAETRTEADTYNSKIDWVMSAAAFDRMDLSHNYKPMLFMFTHNSCNACQQLKQVFNDDGNPSTAELVELSQAFIMVHILDLDSKNFAYTPDSILTGAYVPRIFFASPQGDISHDLTNHLGQKEYPYYYSDVAPIVDNMKNALRRAGWMPVDEYEGNTDEESKAEL